MRSFLLVKDLSWYYPCYSVVSIKRTGSLNYFEVFYHPELFFHELNEIFLTPWSFFNVLNEIFAPPCSLITSCSLNRYYRVVKGTQESSMGIWGLVLTKFWRSFYSFTSKFALYVLMYLLEHFPYFIILKNVSLQGFEPFGAPVVSK